MTAEEPLSVDVVVPTYRRPELLDRCLAALGEQERSADRVLVVAREEDLAAHAVVEAHLGRLPGLELVAVVESGVLAAMSAGVARSTGDIIAFTDDDAAPRPEWIAKLARHLDDPTVGAVGGRDVIRGQEQPLTGDVGRFRRSGRLTGMHHLGTGPARDVDVLKGVNMAFRAEALALPAPGVLRGSGAQVDFEVITCTWVRRKGWRVIYDPSIQVDHAGGARTGPDQRLRPEPSAVADAAFNSVIGASAIGASAVIRHSAYGLLVGTRDRPGLGRAFSSLLHHEPDVLPRLAPTLAGRFAAIHGALTVPYLRVPRVQTAMQLRRGQVRRPQVTLVAHDVHDRGGMERAYAELVRALHNEFELTVVSTSLAEDLRPLVRWSRVRVPRRPFLVKFLMFSAMAGAVVRRKRGDLVHTLGAIVPNRADVASIHFCQAGFLAANGSLAPSTAPLVRRINTTAARTVALFAERWCYRPGRLRVFAAVSEGVGEEAARSYQGIPVVTIPNGVDLARFSPNRPQRCKTRSEFGVDDEVVALFVGGDWHRKGLGIALEATAQVRDAGADVVFWVVGVGDQAQFRELADDLGLGNAVHFFGRRNDTERFYQAADVFVFPTAYEAFSLVMLEAAASGLPLIVPAVNGSQELFENGEAGIIVERSTKAVADALMVLANDPERRAASGAAAGRRVQRFTWAASASATAGLYRHLVASSDAGQ